MDPEKVNEITEWTSAKNIFEVRSFHRLGTFYNKFIRNFSGICDPIMEIIKKDRHPFQWTSLTEK